MPAPAGAPAGTINVTLGGRAVSFRTDPALANAWQPLLSANPPPAGQSEAALVRHLNRIADRVILNAGAAPSGVAFGDWFSAVAASKTRPWRHKGLSSADETRQTCASRTIPSRERSKGSMLALAIAKAPLALRTQAGTVSIADNRIRILLSPLAARDRHGVFVGNCDTLYIENNQAVVQRFGNTTAVPIDGVSVHGVLGLMMIVRQNHLQNFTVGVRVISAFSAADKSDSLPVADCAKHDAEQHTNRYCSDSGSTLREFCLKTMPPSLS